MITSFASKAALLPRASIPQQSVFIAAVPRGGAVSAAATATFDIGLAKTRLEGLAYGTITALITSAALNLFKIVDGDKKKIVPNDTFNNCLKIAFAVACASSVTLGLYTTAIFTIGIYSKTALGMGHTTNFVSFFAACEKFRTYGFRSFAASLATFSISWIIALLLTHEDETRWWIALPAIILSIMGYFHYQELFSLATTYVYNVA